ncbi:hypothetical protein [Symbiopectobacterium sp.]|uniref:hypothetical protein n=1 Tax=Symbiopectobacterium sp. TaxID=2952789 RepID=UPI003F3BA8AC
MLLLVIESGFTLGLLGIALAKQVSQLLLLAITLRLCLAQRQAVLGAALPLVREVLIERYHLLLDQRFFLLACGIVLLLCLLRLQQQLLLLLGFVE